MSMESKSHEDFHGSLNRPQSLIWDQNKQYGSLSPLIQRKSSSTLRKSKSLHNVDQESLFSPINKSTNQLTNEQINIIEQFLQVNLHFLKRK